MGPVGLRICFVSREYPTLGTTGGIGTYTQNLARGLVARGHDVTVLARGEGSSRLESGVRVVPLALPERWCVLGAKRRFGMSLRTLPFIVGAARRFRDLDRERPFDVVELPEYQGWGLGVAMIARCPRVVRLHTHTGLVRRLNDVAQDHDTRLVCALEAASLRCADQWLANSDALARTAEVDFGLPANGVAVLPLGVDTERFSPDDDPWLKQNLGLEPDDPLLLYVGRLERRKGVDVLIEAFAAAVESHPRATLALAGFNTETAPGRRSMAEVLQAQVAEAGLGHCVRFLGHIPYEDLPRYYAGCDLFLAPSLYEPFGMIYLEAMACGRAAIGCQAGGVPEIMRHGHTGVLVEPGNAAELARWIDHLLADQAGRKRIGRRAREAVLQRFSLPVIAARTEQVYRAAIAKGAA